VVKGFIIQGGDFVFGNGSGGESIYNGKKFKDERAGLLLKHDRAGILSMGNSGKNSNTSQFFITLDKAPQCDGKHVVFGHVVSGMEVIRAVESYGEGSEPTVPITITDCGAYTPLWTPGSGSWFDRPDSESYSGITPEFMIRPRVGILAPNKEVAEKFKMALGEHASTLLIVADDIEGGDECIVKEAMNPLENFALDIMVAAPACAGLLASMDIPSSWIDAVKGLPSESVIPSKGEVFLVAKPVDALHYILDRSWVAKRSGWLLSGSFL
jgi:cyclophilin family peptidyl-prolyl cis-trans isomerase